jgi:hypothetical protein
MLDNPNIKLAIPCTESCFSKMDILYLDWQNELTTKANPSQGGDAKLQGPLTGIASFRINKILYRERTYLLFEDRFFNLRKGRDENTNIQMEREE